MGISKLGLAFAILGLVLGLGCELGSLFIKREVRSRVEKALVVDSADHEDYEDWLRTDPDESATLQSFTFLNVTNAAAVLNGSAPVVEPVGPYVFRKFTDKLAVTFPSDGDRVRYKPYTYYKFESSASTSADPELDRVTLPNPTFPGLLARAAGSETDLLSGAMLQVLAGVGASFAVDFPAGARILAFGKVIAGTVAQLAQGLGTSEETVRLMWAGDTFPPGAISAQLAGFPIGTLKDADDASPAQLARLFDPTNKLGLIDKDGAGAWLTRPDLRDQIIAANTLGAATQQYDKIRTWIATYSGSAAYAALVVGGYRAEAQAAGVTAAADQVNSLEDLGFFQWTTGRGLSAGVVLSAVPGAPAPGNPAPELGVACTNDAAMCPGGIRLTVAQARLVLRGPDALSSVAGVTAFKTNAAMLQSTDPATQQAAGGYFVGKLGFSTDPQTMGAQVLMVGNYLTYLLTQFVQAPYARLTTPEGGAGPLATRSVREWLFRYDDPLIKMLAPTNPRSWETSLIGNATSEAEVLEYGLFDEMYTGKSDLDLRRVLTVSANESFVGETTGLPWAHKEEVRGTDATSFEPDTPKGEGVTLTAWVSFVYRAALVAYTGTSEVRGLSTFSFGIPASVLAVDVAKFDQYVRGVFNLTRVTGVPLMVTKPYFLDADLPPVEGMPASSAALHDFVIEVEPITGVVIKGNKRLQYNLRIGPTDAYFPAISESIVPMFWVDESGEISEDDAKTLKKISTTLWVTFVLFIGGFAAGGFFLILGIALCIFKRDAGERPNNRGMEKMVEL